MFTVAQLLILLSAVVGSSALVAMMGWFLTRLRRLEGNAARTAELADQLELLREQVAAARDELGELNERMDFAERLLTSGESPRQRP